MKDRIIEFIESEKLSPAEFADKIGVQRSSVSHVLNGRNNPGFAFIQKILESFTSLNSRWLLTGDGKMYENSQVINKSEPPKPANLFSTPEIKQEMPSEIMADSIKTKDLSIENESLMKFDRDQKQPSNDKKVTRVLIFYDDQTFEDFRPAK